jgi:hypothetical protein
MIETMLMTHSTLIKAFLAFLILGLFIPKMTANDPLKFKKASFLYTMIFQAIITMIVFSGIVALVVAEMDFGMSIIIMIAVFAVMMGIEISKYKKIKKADLEDEATFTMIQTGFTKASVLNLIVLVGITVFMIVKS